MEYSRKLKIGILAELVLLLVLFTAGQAKDGMKADTAMADAALAQGTLPLDTLPQTILAQEENEQDDKKDYIRWVDFNVSSEALGKAYEADIDTYGMDNHIDWISLLAFTAARNGGEFGKQALKDMEAAASGIMGGNTTMEELTAGLSSYAYYKEAYEAVLGGMVGEFLLQEEDETGAVVWKRKYGLKAFSPIAEGFPYSDFDDFGSSRSYGYRRPHLGHDMMGQIGTPI